MLPLLSCFSVSIGPESRFRHWYSSRYLQISPLHREFYSPLPYSILTVSNAVPWLSHGISHSTYENTYTPFTPNKSEQRLPPPYYRGCWHGVSRGFLCPYCHLCFVLKSKYSSGLTELYTPKGFIAHAASHCHPCGHCKIFSTAASRRSLGSVSVPVWLTILLDQLPVVALVGHYPTNKLIGRGLLFWCQALLGSPTLTSS